MFDDGGVDSVREGADGGDTEPRWFEGRKCFGMFSPNVKKRRWDEAQL